MGKALPIYNCDIFPCFNPPLFALGGLHSALLRLLATNYPHLCIVDDWICEEHITGTDALLRRMLLTDAAKKHSPKQLQDGRVVSPMEVAFEHFTAVLKGDWIKSWWMSLSMTIGQNGYIQHPVSETTLNTSWGSNGEGMALVVFSCL